MYVDNQNDFVDDEMLLTYSERHHAHRNFCGSEAQKKPMRWNDIGLYLLHCIISYCCQILPQTYSLCGFLMMPSRVFQ